MSVVATVAHLIYCWALVLKWYLASSYNIFSSSYNCTS